MDHQVTELDSQAPPFLDTNPTNWFREPFFQTMALALCIQRCYETILLDGTTQAKLVSILWVSSLSVAALPPYSAQSHLHPGYREDSPTCNSCSIPNLGTGRDTPRR